MEPWRENKLRLIIEEYDPVDFIFTLPFWLWKY